MTLAPTVPVPVPLLTALLAAATTGRRTDLLTHDAWRCAVTALTGPPGTGWALLLVDVDRFAPVDARHGHPAADAVRAAVAATLRRVAGPGAVVGRFGGDELVTLLPGTDLPAARRVADELCGAVRRLSVDVRAPTGHRRVDGVTISVGVAVRTGTSPDVRVLLWTADAALYAAKRAGGDVARSS